MGKRIKRFFVYLWKRIKKIVATISDFTIQRYGDTQKGIILLFKILVSLLLSVYAAYGATEKIPLIVLVIPLSILIYLILSLAGSLLKPVWLLVQKYKAATLLCGFLFFDTILMLMRIGDTSENAAMISSIVLLLLEVIFARSTWALFHNKKKYPFTIVVFIITLLLNVGVGLLLFGEGFPDSIREKYLALETQEQSTDRIIESEGVYSVGTLTYGISDDSQMKTTTVNLSSFTSYNGKFTKAFRNFYWGYGIGEVPVAGKIWYPEEGDNHPVLFIIHGNHTMVTPSYLGYAYLGEYLASQGYVVVSVDQSFCNGYIDHGLIEENDARAILLLENIKEILSQNQTEDSILYQKIDAENIAIAGHSRGGEAVAVAALFNEYDVYPDNGRITFDYHFDIKTVIAISPTCGQYEPGDREVSLTDINYFLIHGSNDMDVTEFMGMKQYENVSFTGEGEYRKAYLYVAGANHGQFNTEWGRYDLGFPSALFLNTASLLDEEKQQDILKIYFKVCLDVTLKEEDEEEDFLKDCSLYGDSLPDTVYVQGYQDSDFFTICDYEEDSVINKGTLIGSTITGKNLAWMEKYTSFTDVSDDVYADRGNYAVRLNWNKTLNATYTIDLAASDLSQTDAKYLQFDVLDLDDTAVEEGNLSALDFTIVIEYEDGTEESYLLSDYKTVYPPIAVCLSKLDYLFQNTVYKHHFQTIFLPMTFSSNQISSIRFEFDQADHGLIMIDNIGFTR